MEDNEKTEVIPEEVATETEISEAETEIETPEVVNLRKELEETKVKLKEQERVASKHANKVFELESRIGDITTLRSEQSITRQELRQIAQELGIELKAVEPPEPETKATETTQAEDPAIIAFQRLLDEEGIAYDDAEMLKIIEGKTPKEALKVMKKAIKDKETEAIKKELGESNRLAFQKLAKAHGLTVVETGSPSAIVETSEEQKLKQRYPTMASKS